MVGMRRVRTSRTLLVGSGFAVLALLAGCSSNGGTSNATSTSPSASASPTVSPTPTPKPTPSSPLSGLPGGIGKPIVAVKIDNIVDARPHVGIQSADLVYVEEVEGGLTRIMALFNTTYPKKIGPVRSARISDIDLLAPYNHILFAYSGAQQKMYPIIAAAPVIDVGDNYASNAYTRDYTRYAPHNLFANGPTLVADGLPKKPTMAHDMGWVFNATPPAGGIATTSVKAYWPAATATATWDPTTNKWIIGFDGSAERDVATGRAVRAATVIIQYVDQTNSIFHDHFGGITPYIHSIGTGHFIVLRNGRRWGGTWLRPNAASPTQYWVAGRIFPFNVGPEWIFLVKNDRPVTITPTPAPAAKPTASATPLKGSQTHASPKS